MSDVTLIFKHCCMNLSSESTNVGVTAMGLFGALREMRHPDDKVAGDNLSGSEG